MTKFLDPKMVFPPAKLPKAKQSAPCEHKFTLFTIELGWHCRHCGEKDKA